MAKKKKPHKKTRRARASVAPAAASRPANPPAPATPAAVAPIPAVAAASAQPLPPVAPANVRAAANRPITIDRSTYVAGDLRRVAVLITICVILEAILWFLFNHTGLGDTVYRHISL